MTQASSQQVSLEDTPYYHCISRCVRRAFLCGEDHLTGENYEHRKQWVVDKLAELSEVFAIDVCAYAVLSNHYHVIVHVDIDTAKNWNQEEVIERWRQLFSGGVLIERYLAGQCKTDAELDKVAKTAEIWRARLMDISWFMRCLNESISRQANKEDSCKGRFWEGRFKSQSLLDERALLACMVYVDLNPVRAGICETPEASDFTSIQQRLRAYQEKAADNQTPSCSKTDAMENIREASRNIQLNAFTGGFNTQKGVPFDGQDYFELTDWTGRAVHPKKKGSIPNGLPSLLTRLGMPKENWIETVVSYEKHFSDYVGQEARIREAGALRGMKWVRGLRACQRLFSTSNNDDVSGGVKMYKNRRFQNVTETRINIIALTRNQWLARSLRRRTRRFTRNSGKNTTF